MCEEVEEGHSLFSSLQVTEQNLPNILKICDSFLEGVTSIMRVALIKHITTAISSAPKKTPEKSGAQ
jgi:hypothetical protein